MKKEFTKENYNDYMFILNWSIRNDELSLKGMEDRKRISQLSFEDWVKFQNGELKISDLKSNETTVPKEFQWTDDSVIDFVNWFLKLHKLPFKYSLENMSILDSFKNGDDYKLWHKPKEK